MNLDVGGGRFSAPTRQLAQDRADDRQAYEDAALLVCLGQELPPKCCRPAVRVRAIASDRARGCRRASLGRRATVGEGGDPNLSPVGTSDADEYDWRAFNLNPHRERAAVKYCAVLRHPA